MPGKRRIVVVGTTTDYFELLAARFKDKLIFLTDFQEKVNRRESRIDPSIEVLTDCEDYEASLNALKEHVRVYDITLSGVVCFDCESLALASVIASKFSLPFPTLEAVLNCRSKFKSKQIWQQNNIPCPSCALTRSQEAAATFKDLLGGPVVLKPLTGSGSELVFYCPDTKSCQSAFGLIKQKLSLPSNKRMYSLGYMPKEHDPRNVVVIEQFIGGDEYSCDFVLDNNKVKLIRFSKKIIRGDSTFGTVSAYILPASFPVGWDQNRLEARLLEASKCLGLNRTIAMVDLKFENNEFYLIELTPRLGGDCLPPLILASCGFDIFKVALDFSEGKDTYFPEFEFWTKSIGMHIIAQRQGILRKMDLSELSKDKRVVSFHLKRNPGDMIRLPPQDYDSRILGYILFKPDEESSIEDQCSVLLKKCVVEMEEHYAVG